MFFAGWMVQSVMGCGSEPRLDIAGVVLVSIDTLRADRLGAYGSTRGLTPNLDHFASQSVIFDLTFAQSNETLYSHASLFTSRYPSELDRLGAGFRMPSTVPTLASVFHDAGWTTGAFVAGGHLSAAFGLGTGFTTYDDREDWGSLRDTGAHALRWLDGRPKDAPFFAFIHGYDTHDRYLKPPPFGYLVAEAAYHGAGADLARRPGATSRIVSNAYTDNVDALDLLSRIHPRFRAGREIATLEPNLLAVTPADAAQLAGVYDGSVAWADASFGLLMSGLEARGLLDRVVIVVISDHGEELGEAGAFHHRFALSDATLRVPLLVRQPAGRLGGRRVGGLVELIDVAPTLWELAGVHPQNESAGVSLVPVLDGRAAADRSSAFSEGALRLLSVRSPTARLVSEGLSVDNPFAAGLLAVAPVDGTSLSLVGPQSEADPLRAALVERLVARERNVAP